jgi:hypothetical protein
LRNMKNIRITTMTISSGLMTFSHDFMTFSHIFQSALAETAAIAIYGLSVHIG